MVYGPLVAIECESKQKVGSTCRGSLKNPEWDPFLMVHGPLAAIECKSREQNGAAQPSKTIQTKLLNDAVTSHAPRTNSNNAANSNNKRRRRKKKKKKE